MTTHNDIYVLEQMIDRLGLEEVLNCLAGICVSKAEHIRSNWQEEGMAKVWDREGGRISTLADSVNV